METPMNADAPPIAADHSRAELDALSHRIIGAAFRVGSKLGRGFLEKVYENSLVLELRRAGLRAEPQRPVQVRYEGEVVGDYVTDILVEGAIVLEIKALDRLDRVHFAQCVNYLRATGFRVCLLLNFGRSSLELKRIVRNY
jgi:GxxExxY protein